MKSLSHLDHFTEILLDVIFEAFVWLQDYEVSFAALPWRASGLKLSFCKDFKLKTEYIQKLKLYLLFPSKYLNFLLSIQKMGQHGIWQTSISLNFSIIKCFHLYPSRNHTQIRIRKANETNMLHICMQKALICIIKLVFI